MYMMVVILDPTIINHVVTLQNYQNTFTCQRHKTFYTADKIYKYLLWVTHYDDNIIFSKRYFLGCHANIWLFCYITLTICVISSDTMLLLSSTGHSNAPDTLVPPPNGITHTSCFTANSIIFSTSLWLPNQQR